MLAVHDFLQDTRFGFRLLRKEPVLTLAAVLSIALGVAANTTVFTFANKVLFQRLPVEQPDSLYAVYGFDKGDQPGETISYPDYRDLAAEKAVFQSVASYFPLVPANLAGLDGRPSRLWGQIVTGNYFDVVRMRPILGRTFSASEDQVPDRDFVVVLSHHTWRTKLGADPNIAGKTILLNQRPLTVIGVAAPDFRGTDTGLVADFWIPMALYRSMAAVLSENRENRMESRGHQWLFALARLQPGVSIALAQTALHTIGARLGKAYPDTNKDQSFYIERAGQLNPAFRGSAVAFLWLLLAVMLMVLLIACCNVANLLLARAARRQREIGTRLAMGAGRGRIIRQLLAESFLLAAAGGVFAILLTRLAQAGLARTPIPFPVPLDFTTVIDWRVATFALLLTLLTTLVFGLAPALRAGRTALLPSLRVLTSDGAATPRRFRAANVLIVAQISAALLLLIGTGLVLRSLRNAHTIDIGFNPRHVYALAIDPLLDGMRKDQLAPMLNQIRHRLRAIPGVTAVSFCDMLPLSIGGQATTIRSAGNRTQGAESSVTADLVNVGPEFVEAMGMKLVSGSSDLPTHAGGPVPALVNEEMVRRLWPSQHAIGRIFYRGDTPHQVAGVVRNLKMRTLGETTRSAFFPVLDSAFQGGAPIGFRVLVRSNGSVPPDLLRHELRVSFPSVSLFDVERVEDHVTNAQILPRMAAVIFGFAGCTALLLAITGLFGVVHYSVSRRSREFGIRMAVGADSSRILRMVLRQGSLLAAIGVAIGLAAAFAASRLLAGILYGVSPNDALTFTVAPAMLLAVALPACLVPAWRASRLHPSSALREE